MTQKSIIVSVSIALLIVGAYFSIDRPGRRSYQEYVALGGSEPWGQLYPPSTDPPNTVIVYHEGHNGIVCFDAFFSQDLHDRLLAKNRKLVSVEYDTFSDFGKIRGFNVRSIDGIVLANGTHVLQPEIDGPTGVLGKPTTGKADGNDCW